MVKLRTEILEPEAHNCFDNSLPSIEQLGTYIRNKDYLVVMPTETVYGLAANALSQSAVEKIFEAKQRPLNDPLICHVESSNNAMNLLELTDSESNVFKILTKYFWPGPLTIVAKASKIVPEIITASTNFVAVRSPKHPVAQALIKAAQVPLAAPSANMFGHISPSLAVHVFNNFHATLKESSQSVLYILDGGPCSIGIESSVCRIQEIDKNKVNLSILRKGSITLSNINDVLEAHLSSNDYFLSYYNANFSHKQQSKMLSPGLSIKHYAPKKPTFLVLDNTKYLSQSQAKFQNSLIPLNKCVFIDVSGNFINLEDKMIYYYSMKTTKENVFDPENLRHIHQNLFNSLHEGEKIAFEKQASLILIGIFDVTAAQTPELAYSIYDRYYRAASGRIAEMI